MSKTMQENLELFASLSGDYNPIHLDAHFAKNSYFGTQIIYGIYQVFCTLELALAKVPQKSLILSNIKATFHAPISKDLASQMKIKGSFSTHNIECSGGGGEVHFFKSKLANQSFHWSGRVFIKGECMSSVSFTLSQSQNLKAQSQLPDSQISETNQKCESIDYNPDILKKLFPLCETLLNKQSIGTLLASTRIVGMQTPGLHSIYSSLSLALTHTSATSTLHYTHKTHSLLQLTTLNFTHPMQGVVKAFTRPQRLSNQTFDDLLATYDEILKTQPFKEQRALVIGAGNGLGNTCAKLLALGGAQVLATTLTGSFDESHQHIQTTHFNSLKINQKTLRPLHAFHPTHLYYFATPPIIAQHTQTLNKKRFVAFLEYYVLAPSRILQALKELKAIFQPSSIFVEDLPIDFCEYTLAKATLESYGHFLNKKGFHTATPRLQKVATNQTLSLIPQNLQSPSEALIRELLSFSKHSKESHRKE